MPQYIDAYGFIYAVSGAMLCFGCPGCLCQRKNSLTIFPVIAAAFFGVAFNMHIF
jgi:hypothetical protein